MQISLLFAVISSICFHHGFCSQIKFLDGRSSQQHSVEPAAFLQEGRAEVQSSSDESLIEAPVCDSSLSDPICFAERRGALLPTAVPSGLVGHWDFNADSPLDLSGNGHHGVTELLHGPAPAGNGHSAVFSRTFMMVPHKEQLRTRDFTYSFWIYLLDDGTVPSGIGRSAAWCPLVRKGIHDPKTQQFASAPSLLFNHRTGRLRAEVTTTIMNTEDGEQFDSNARLLPNRWVHIALVLHSSRSTLMLYVNGILDNAMTTQGTTVTNEYPLYIGGDPFTVNECAFTVYVDELRLFAHAVPPHLLQAEAAPALGGVDPSYVRLACLKCTLEEAAQRCPRNRHICTAMELHTGGYQVARSLGWLEPGAHVWTHAAVVKGASVEMGMQASSGNADSMGLGLCCDGAA
jgi:hypothetical protein